MVWMRFAYSLQNAVVLFGKGTRQRKFLLFSILTAEDNLQTEIHLVKLAYAALYTVIILLSSSVVTATHLLSIPLPLLVKPSTDTMYVVNLRKLAITADVADWLTTVSLHVRLFGASAVT